MQIPQAFDKETIEKIKRSALISLGGFIVAVVPMLVPTVTQMLQSHPSLALAAGAFGAWVVNTIKEWLAGSTK